MNKQKEDMIWGRQQENNIHQTLETYFGKLEDTKNNPLMGERFEFDKYNDKYMIEIKSRRINHDKYDSLFFGENKYVKGCELLTENPERKIYYLWNCEDGIYYWLHNSSTFTKRNMGRYDRGRDEIKPCIDIKQCDIKLLEENSID